MQKKTDTFNASEAADFLHAHVETVRRLARKGEIPSFKIGKDWRFLKEDLIKWAQSKAQINPSSTILIIDDEPSIRSYLRKLLHNKGFKVFDADSGEAGLKCLQEQTVDLILLDLKMPKMNGAEFLARLQHKRMKIPVVLITGYPESDLINEAMQYSPLMLLSKPLGNRQLLDAIGAIVKNPG
jgi:excisionase family DNA binding protein